MGIKHIWYAKKTPLRSAEAVHQTLMFGGLKDIRSLQKTIGKDAAKSFFLRYPKKIYNNPALHFVKNFILGIQTPIDEQKYLKNTPRRIG